MRISEPIPKYVFLIFLLFATLKVYSDNQEWRMASTLERSGLYEAAIQKYKQLAVEEKDTEWYIESITSIARCFSNLNMTDSTLYYGELVLKMENTRTTDLAKTYEECIQNVFWSYLKCNQYGIAKNIAEKVLSLRENIYGYGSDQHIEWIGVMSHQAYKNGDYDGLKNYCQKESSVSEQIYGLDSSQFQKSLSMIRAYANQLSDTYPEFVMEWIEYYYNELQIYSIHPDLQYEFEVLLLECFLTMNNLKEADKYAIALKKRMYDQKDIPLNDQVRIFLKLALYNQEIGDSYTSRYNINQAWDLLANAKEKPNLEQLIDRHIVERKLRVDSLGKNRINSEWLIETSLPIVEANTENPDILAFFFESLGYAYEGLEKYDLAIQSMKESIEFYPLDSRVKKLAQFYISDKKYELAEKEYLNLYTNLQLLDPLRKSIESDLTSLYWLWGKREKLIDYLFSDFNNLKSEIRNAFAFLNEQERERFLDKSLLGSNLNYDMYTGYSNGEDQWNVGNEMAYNLALVQKSLLLSTTKDIKDILKAAPDSIKKQVQEYERFKSLHETPTFIEDDFSRQKRMQIIQFVVENPKFLKQLNYTWSDIHNQLNDNDAAIEFINLCGITPENINDGEPSIGALILRKDSQFPIFVKLATDSIITGLYEHGEDGERLNDMIYSGKAQKEMYKIIWEPLSPYLTDIKTVYYSPTGVLQDINLDWICDDNAQFLSDKYNLYRLSSTRELCNDKNIRNSSNTVLYGDIEYSISNTQLHESPKSKYRSTTRNGFGPLNGTALEIDSITATLDSYLLPSKNFRKDIATEESFRALSGNSPKNIHIATHGFYYSNEALECEYKSGNNNSFIAFQGMNPELYHSGLALAGAQDTWTNEAEDIQKYIDMDSDNDGILLSSEISKLDLSKTDLVVLSACETALGSVKSEGVYGLQRAFKLAGVNSIIMSLWKVDDDATQMLMTSFYKNYLNGMSKREALLSAQRLVRETPGFEDPYYWAAFILLDGLN